MTLKVLQILTFAKRYWESVIVAIIISYLSLAPGSEFSKIPSFPNEDKLIHFLMYFGLAFVLFGDFLRRFGQTIIRQHKLWILIIVLPVLLGGTMELLQQYLTSSRTGDWLDELTNTLGTLTGFFAGKWILPHILKTKKQ